MSYRHNIARSATRVISSPRGENQEYAGPLVKQRPIESAYIIQCPINSLNLLKPPLAVGGLSS